MILFSFKRFSPPLALTIVAAISLSMNCLGSTGEPANQRQNPQNKLSNQLHLASSAYLLSAKDQPVHWQLWGEEAFQLAKELDRPILLDIGAVWCHWCHVMDRESYENEDIAKIINDNFIAIKVDRDELPDVDKRYQLFLQSMGIGGGWPLTAFLDAEGVPFYGGTYFPPETNGSTLGLKEILQQLTKAYKERRDEITKNANNLVTALSNYQKQLNKNGELAESVVSGIKNSIERSFDAQFGGFGDAPKFPNNGAIDLALTLHYYNQDSNLRTIAETTLKKMAEGGIHDHIGGGFHRYSVDKEWGVPHFEKMTDVNAFILNNFLEMFKATGDSSYLEPAEGIIEYYLRDMTDSVNGGFYAHQDADVGLEDDGSYYTWTKQEIENILTKAEADIVIRYYDIRDKPLDLTETPDRNVIRTKIRVDRVAALLNIDELTVSAGLISAKSILLQERMKRKRPFIDKTLLADKNGMMLSAFIRAGNTLHRPQLQDFAKKTADYLIKTMFDADEGFAHAYDGKNARIYNLLSDQVWMSYALLDLFETTGENKYLDISIRLADIILAKYYDSDNGGFFDRIPGNDVNQLLSIGIKSFEDSPVPSDNYIAIRLLDRLFALTDNRAYFDAAERTLKSFVDNTKEEGIYYTAFGLALYFHLNPPPQVVIIRNAHDTETQKLIDTARSVYRPGKEVYVFDAGQSGVANLPPIVKGKLGATSRSNKSVAFVCTGFACALPTSDPARLTQLIKEFGRN